MLIRKFTVFFFILGILLIVSFLIYKNFFYNNEIVQPELETKEDIIYNSNIIRDVNYTTKDSNGNEYIITALKGEIDFSNSNIIFLTNVNAVIKLKYSDIITIASDFGKYNSENFDTIFSKNVILNYLDNKITGEYLDFSLSRNSMIISRNIVYTNSKNVLKADVIEMDIKTKDTKIFMYENKKKVNIKSKD